VKLPSSRDPDCRICDTLLTVARPRRRNVRVPEPPPDSPEFARWLRRTTRHEDFEALPEDDPGALRRFGVRKTWPTGATLFRQGGPPEVLFVIEQGEVELVYETKHERLIAQIVRAGSSVGDLPVLLERPYLYTAVTRTETTTLGFSLETVRTLLEVDPRFASVGCACSLSGSSEAIGGWSGLSAVRQVNSSPTSSCSKSRIATRRRLT
jgi:hypothetical protein